MKTPSEYINRSNSASGSQTSFANKRYSLLASPARVQAPWIKVTIGTYTFGVFSRKGSEKDINGFYSAYDVQYPNYVDSLSIIKLNGQVNQYTLTLNYPVRSCDDPNFFEKVFSSVNNTRKIIFSYGDSTNPTMVYKDEEAIITKISQSFNLKSSAIQYTVSAVSGAALCSSGTYSFLEATEVKPSDVIKRLFKNPNYKLSSIFTGMSLNNLDDLIAGDDAPVALEPKINISILDYISYLVSCMIPAGSTSNNNISNDIYILTIHDETSYDNVYGDELLGGPYFKVTKTSYRSEQSDAFEIDIGYNTSTLVTDFSVVDNENYSLLYDYQKQLHPTEYVERLDENGKWVKTFAPTSTSKNDDFLTTPADITWWTKITKYPINATITIQGLLRPAMLMSHVRLNIIFPGGHKHIASGLYIVTKQTDSISRSGYRTMLNLTKISGDNYISTNPNNK